MDTNDGTQMPIRNDTFINKSQHTRNMFFFLYLLRIECLDNVFLLLNTCAFAGLARWLHFIMHMQSA